MKFRTCLSILILSALISCKNVSDQDVPKTPDDAESLISFEHGELLDSFIRIAEQDSVDLNGLIRTEKFSSLIDGPLSRAKVREIVKKHTRSAIAKNKFNDDMEPILIKGFIYDEASNKALENVSIELIHTDAEGKYFDEEGSWNPKIFFYLRSDNKGMFTLMTHMPGKYSDDHENITPSHIHFTLEHPSYRMYASEFSFDDDTVIVQEGNSEDLILAELFESDSLKTYSVQIPMQAIGE